MKDSLEIPVGIQPNDSSEIKDLKSNLRNQALISEEPELLLSDNLKNNDNINKNMLKNLSNDNIKEDLVNIKMNHKNVKSSFNRGKREGRSEKYSTVTTVKNKGIPKSYKTFLKNIRSTTPDINKSSSGIKFKGTSNFSKSLNNFFKKSQIYNFDEEDSSEINLNKLTNVFQHFLGKLNDKNTTEISFKKCKEIIEKNCHQEALRIYLRALSSLTSTTNVTAKEYYALLYGFISSVYKENLMDPLDMPPNIIKTINRILTHIKNIYLTENSYIVHKACSHSINELYDNCTPKDNIKNIHILFISPLLDILANGTSKTQQEGAAICLSGFVYHLGQNDLEINRKILSTLEEKVVNLCTKSSLDNPYIFETLYNLINFGNIESFSNYLNELYQRIINILSKQNKNKYSPQLKIKVLNVLSLLGTKLQPVSDIQIGYFLDEILKVIESNTKDKTLKVQLAAKEAKKNWENLSAMEAGLQKKKEHLVENEINPQNYIEIIQGNNGDLGEKEVKLVRKMDKLNFLRNLAKKAKLENKKVENFDVELPEKMKEEVYKKGIGNILKLSNFLKNKQNNLEKNEEENRNFGKGRSLRNIGSRVDDKLEGNRNKLMTEINDYLRHSRQVKKFDAIVKTNTNNINVEDNSNDCQDNPELIEEEQYNSGNKLNPQLDSKLLKLPEIKRGNDCDKIYLDDNIHEKKNSVPFTFNKRERGGNFDEFNEMNSNIINNEDLYEQIEDSNNNIIINKNRAQNFYKDNNDQNSNNIKNENDYINESNKYESSRILSGEERNNNNNPDFSSLKNNLESLILPVYSSFTSFEKTCSLKLDALSLRISDISAKILHFEKNPNFGEKINRKVSGVDEIKESFERIKNTSFFINNHKFSDKRDNVSTQTVDGLGDKTEIKDEIYREVMESVKRELEENRKDIIRMNKKQSDKLFYKNNRISADSEITKIWKKALNELEQNHFNDAYDLILNSGDDIYLLRLLCITGTNFQILDKNLAKKVLLRVNLISKSHQIQHLLVNLVKFSYDYGVFSCLDKREQNNILDSLYEFSGLNNKLGAEAAELYTKLTKRK